MPDACPLLMPDASSTPLPIIHATDRFVVIDKPEGLLSVPGKGAANQDCVAARVRVMFPHATGPLVVHRLDMDTSGLIVLGLDPDAQRDLSAQFERRTVEKTYTALVHGLVPAERGVIDLPIRPDLTNRPYQVADPSHHRIAITHWRVLALETDRTRLELTPITGRTHQLRVHCAHLFRPHGHPPAHPILGDILYAPSSPSSDPASSPPRLMLHATTLELNDPATGRRHTFTSPPPF